ncbi:MAG: glutaminyl-peptide cyclotransferase [Fibrobacter sp.]|nr:glutaminyl-peptide cyclotransferase [Fibrobacter sp.]
MKQLSIILFTLISALFAAPQFSWQVVESLAHPPERFTQGLFWHQNELWECTGISGKSAIYRSDAKGKLLAQKSIAAPHFGEGCVVHNGALFVLTWQSRVGFIYDLNSLNQIGSFPINGEGWGLTQKDGYLWMTNGSAYLYQMDPANMQVKDSVLVKDGEEAVLNLNELDNTPWGIAANVWYKDSIAFIDEKSGKVQGWLDLRELRSRSCGAGSRCDVLNGVAWDGKHLWVTGKFWPKMWVLKLSTGLPKSSGTPKR